MSDPTPSSLPPEPPPIEPAPSSSTPQSAAVPPLPETTGLPPHIAAALACFFSILGGIVFLVLEKKNQFVRFYAMQSTILGGLWIVVFLGLSILMMILHPVPLIGALAGWAYKLAYLAFVLVWLMTVFKAFSGKEWEIPYLGKIAREQLAKRSTTTP